MNANSYLERTLQRDIQLIRTKVVEMGSLAERALLSSLEALKTGNRQLAYSVIFRDQLINEAENELDRLCLEFLVRQQPVAGHLRFAYATIKINYELERIGDYAESISKQVLKISAMPIQGSLEKLWRIADRAIPMIKDAVEAFATQNVELARKTMQVEVEIDFLKDELNAWVVEAREKSLIPLEALAPLLTIVRRYERVSDQARHICEEVLYMCTGENVRHQGTEVCRVLFLDDHNSGRSQIAEVLANSLVLDKFVFSSAGVNPKPMESRLLSFFQNKEFDLSKQFPKKIEDVPLWDHHQVIVALSPGSRQLLPSSPTKSVHLEWMGIQPENQNGSGPEYENALEQVCEEISRHIRELVEVIQGEKFGVVINK